MTNYTNYPKHRLKDACFVICFGPRDYSWCLYNKSNLFYMLNSHYIDNAFYIDFCINGIVMHQFTVYEFRDFYQCTFIDVVNETVKGNRT